ncbi:abnormal spindle-like microcephaly-associated protein homolog [Zophobas morio]|uniref:abnormal spindle-like microcephaly-associated protein homolog n=1 Tax=Zophobas morio TaxID=2755281 RepID=UPI0030837897
MEYEYEISRISMDLRDGIRLARLYELLTGDSLVSKLKPILNNNVDESMSNIQLVLGGFTSRGMVFESESLLAYAVANGHRERTLQLLWAIVIYFGATFHLNEAMVAKELHSIGSSVLFTFLL